jgi:hypothetical protein
MTTTVAASPALAPREPPRHDLRGGNAMQTPNVSSFEEAP